MQNAMVMLLRKKSCLVIETARSILCYNVFMLPEPNRPKESGVSPSTTGGVSVEVTGEMAPPPHAIKSLEPHVTFVPHPIPSIPDNTLLEHAGEAIPISTAPLAQLGTERALTKKEKLTLSDSKFWRNVLEEKLKLQNRGN